MNALLVPLIKSKCIIQKSYSILLFLLFLLLSTGLNGQLKIPLYNGNELKLNFKLPPNWKFQTQGTTSPFFWMEDVDRERTITVDFPYKDWSDGGTEKWQSYPVTFNWKCQTSINLNAVSGTKSETEVYNSLTQSFSEEELKKVSTGKTKISGYPAYYVYYEDHNMSMMDTYSNGDPQFHSPEFNIRAKYLITIDDQNQVELYIESRGEFTHWTNEEGEDLKILDNPKTKKSELVTGMDQVLTNARSTTKSGIRDLIRSLSSEKEQNNVVVLRGGITVPDVYKKFGRPFFPLPGVEVSLLKNGTLLSKVTADKDGNFLFDEVKETSGLKLHVELKDGEHNPSLFRILYDQDPMPVKMSTETFNCKPKGETEKNILISPNSGLEINEQYKKHISDLALIYAFSYYAHKGASDIFNIDLDFNLPLDIKTFNRDFDIPMWIGPLSDGQNMGSDPVLVFSVASSMSSQELTIDLVSHEIGHAMMADAFGNKFPYDPKSISHAGYINESTCDSWTEGFATFFASIIKKEMYNDEKPSLTCISGFPIDIEVNYRATSGIWTKDPVFSREEYAVAGLLWDLVDPVSKHDITTMLYEPSLKDEVVSYNAPPNAIPMTDYYDQVQIPVVELWKILSSRDYSDQSPVAKAQGYPYLFDVRQLYNRLVKNNVGSKLTDKGISTLDEIFIAHGFFEDINLQNFCFEKKERVGYTGSLPMRLNRIELKDRTGRRSPPPMDDSYILYDDGQFNTRKFNVTAEFNVPHEYYNSTFEIYASTPGRIHFLPVDPEYQVTYTFAPQTEQNQIHALKIYNQEWWSMRKKKKSAEITYDIRTDKSVLQNVSTDVVNIEIKQNQTETSNDYTSNSPPEEKHNFIKFYAFVLLGMTVFLFFLHYRKLSLLFAALAVLLYTGIIPDFITKDGFKVEHSDISLEEYQGEWIDPSGALAGEVNRTIDVIASGDRLIGKAISGTLHFDLVSTGKHTFQGDVFFRGVQSDYYAKYDQKQRRLTFSWDLTPSTWYIEKRN